MDRPTLDDLLAEAKASGVARLDAHCLAAHHLGRSRAWVVAHGDAPMEPRVAQALRRSLSDRAQGVPLAYLTGEREFRGLTLHVTPDTLIPRPDTETLIDWALELLSPLKSPTVADLGTGSGAIALALRHSRPDACVTAVERSAAALAVARGNGERLGLRVEWMQGNWWDPLDSRQFDLVLANPPYIDAADPHLEALRFEPHEALSPGPDGMAAIDLIVQGAARHLVPGGWLLVEHGWNQGAAVAARMSQCGGQEVRCRRDLAGHPRCTGATWRA